MELILHSMGKALFLLSEHYKRPHNPFPKAHKIYSKKVIQEKFFIFIFCRLVEGNGQNQAPRDLVFEVKV